MKFLLVVDIDCSPRINAASGRYLFLSNESQAHVFCHPSFFESVVRSLLSEMIDAMHTRSILTLFHRREGIFETDSDEIHTCVEKYEISESAVAARPYPRLQNKRRGATIYAHHTKQHERTSLEALYFIRRALRFRSLALPFTRASVRKLPGP
jgi:hypothetical protein